jgi:RNA recognition motif-containing protein
MNGMDPTNLFVTNFSWNLTEDDMRNIFSEYGELESVKLITDRETGRSR